LTAIGASSALLVAMAASPAAADTGAATANAIHVTVGGAQLVDTGTCIATSSGAPTGVCTTATSQTNIQQLVGASVITQSATASGANSAACAGATGPGGGSIQVGLSGQCIAPVNPAAGGVVLLNGLVTADAVYATCSDNGGTPTGSSTTLTLKPTNTGGALGSLTNLLGTLGTLTQSTTGNHIVVSLNPIVGSPIDLLTLDLNTQTTTGAPPVITVTALDLKVLPGLTNLAGVGTLLGITAGSAAEVRIGQVTCGPNAITVVTPVIPLKGAPIAAAIMVMAAYVGWRFWWTPRRRRTEGIGA